MRPLGENDPGETLPAPAMSPDESDESDDVQDWERVLIDVQLEPDDVSTIEGGSDDGGVGDDDFAIEHGDDFFSDEEE